MGRSDKCHSLFDMFCRRGQMCLNLVGEVKEERYVVYCLQLVSLVSGLTQLTSTPLFHKNKRKLAIRVC